MRARGSLAISLQLLAALAAGACGKTARIPAPSPTPAAGSATASASSSGAGARESHGDSPAAAGASTASRPPTQESYQPPADGRLTRQQVEGYLAVQGRMRRDRRAVSTAPADVVEDLGQEVRAAQESGLSAEEYLWVKESILEAEASVEAARLNAAAIALLERTLSDLRARSAEARDEPTKKLLAEQTASFDDELSRVRREAAEKEPDGVVANVKLLEPYRDRVKAFDQEMARARPIAAELAAREKAGTPTPLPPPPKEAGRPGAR